MINIITYILLLTIKKIKKPKPRVITTFNEKKYALIL